MRSLPELRTFALELVNRDRILNNLPPLPEDPELPSPHNSMHRICLTKEKKDTSL
ncbi:MULTISPECIES: hypothetical protein [unclassified Nodularia (in: cyanobacteria)]|uniref:hypothetical protein n=1 Tax=unclassified Nodularia (in: cyanobacteria) TaxID=2656917 RepID=UPI00188110E0|nr:MULTISPECIES: hypothetical protein [unclassified Nodularia (in: cyanobacteria)]MBE9198640.1 hypothetical protein [Nodularia sp. LEGE 06071]MCC2691791.1 hypothetical protein [Nodularia sp. LEGE 04288]